MGSTSSSHGGMLLATAMAVSGTVLLLAFGMQKSTNDFMVNSLRQSLPQAVPPRSCLSSGGCKKEKKKKKRVHFAADVGDHNVVVDEIRDDEEYRKKIRKYSEGEEDSRRDNNRMALYNGILRDRVHHRVAYSDSDLCED